MLAPSFLVWSQIMRRRYRASRLAAPFSLAIACAVANATDLHSLITPRRTIPTTPAMPSISAPRSSTSLTIQASTATLHVDDRHGRPASAVDGQRKHPSPSSTTTFRADSTKTPSIPLPQQRRPLPRSMPTPSNIPPTMGPSPIGSFSTRFLPACGTRPIRPTKTGWSRSSASCTIPTDTPS